MKLLELSLRDYGVFGGINIFNLSPSNGRIVLFGGKNGSGKTTILQAIQLCLYGSRALGERVSQKEYEDFLLDRFHRGNGSNKPSKYASISILFDFANFETLELFEVTRAWKRKKNRVVEDLFIKKDGAPISGLARDRWQDFINDVIPPGVSRLFFFDGEKIQSLATENFGGETLHTEIKRLLGLNLVERLQADLDTYLVKQRKQQALPEARRYLEDQEQAVKQAENEYIQSKSELAHIESMIALKQSKIEEVELQVHGESRGYALKRDNLKEQLNKVETGLEQTEEIVRSLASKLLPFALIPEKLKDFEEVLRREAESHQWLTTKEFVQARVKRTKRLVRAKAFWNDLEIEPRTKKKIITALNDHLNDFLIPPNGVDDIPIIHELSKTDRTKIINWIQEATTEIPNQTIHLGNEIEKLNNQRDEISSKLRRIPDDEILQPLMHKLKDLSYQLGELKEKANHTQQELISRKFHREEAKRILEKAFDELRGSTSLERRLRTVHKTQDVLDRFITRTANAKIKELEELITARFNELHRKSNLIENISIDLETFEVTLFARDKQEISLTQLSSGEKQIWAISLLWALRQLSGRPFPIAIDTPLARLDSDHRENIVQRYFPYASHQVLLFSTDTEVDRRHFDLLKPHLSHSYHLEYDESLGQTQIHEGYFWGEPSHAA